MSGGITTLLEKNQQRTLSDARKTVAEFRHPAFSPIGKLLWLHAKYDVAKEADRIERLRNEAVAEARERDAAAVDHESLSGDTNLVEAAHKEWQRRVLRRLEFHDKRGVPGAGAVARIFALTLRQQSDAHASIVDTTADFLRRLRQPPGPEALDLPASLLADGDELIADARASLDAQDGAGVVHEVSAWELRPALKALIAAMDEYRAARQVTEDEHGEPLPLFNLTASKGGAWGSVADDDDEGSGGSGGPGFSGTGERGM